MCSCSAQMLEEHAEAPTCQKVCAGLQVLLATALTAWYHVSLQHFFCCFLLCPSLLAHEPQAAHLPLSCAHYICHISIMVCSMSRVQHTKAHVISNEARPGVCVGRQVSLAPAQLIGLAGGQARTCCKALTWYGYKHHSTPQHSAA